MPSEEQIRALKKRYSAKLLAMPCVVGVGVEREDNGEFVLAVHLADDAPEELRRELAGQPVRFIRTGRYTKF